MGTCRIIVLLFPLSALAVPFATADPVTIASTPALRAITITSGSAVIGPGATGFGPISLGGGSGFSLTGTLGPGGTLDVKSTCFPCMAGTPLSLGGSFGALGLSVNSATLNGVRYTNINQAGSAASMWLDISSWPVFTPPVDAESAVLSSPVTISSVGPFSLAPPGASPVEGTLTGSGTAWLTLVRTPDNLWEYGGMRYDFSSAASTVTPEPASYVPLGTGLVVAARVARRRRTKGIKEQEASQS